MVVTRVLRTVNQNFPSPPFSVSIDSCLSVVVQNGFLKKILVMVAANWLIAYELPSVCFMGKGFKAPSLLNIKDTTASDGTKRNLYHFILSQCAAKVRHCPFSSSILVNCMSVFCHADSEYDEHYARLFQHKWSYSEYHFLFVVLSDVFGTTNTV